MLSCTIYLYNLQSMLDQRSPYLRGFSQSCMACLLVVLMAASSLLLFPRPGSGRCCRELS